MKKRDKSGAYYDINKEMHFVILLILVLSVLSNVMMGMDIQRKDAGFKPYLSAGPE